MKGSAFLVAPGSDRVTVLTALLGLIGVIDFVGCDGPEDPPDPEPAALPRLNVVREPLPPAPSERDEANVGEVYDGDDAALYTNVYTIPPDFLSRLKYKEDEPSSPNPADPFATGTDASGAPQPRWGTTDILKSHGVEFGAGASTIYGPPTSQLIVRNTRKELEKIEAILDKLNSEANRWIKLRVEIFAISGAALTSLRTDLEKADTDSKNDPPPDLDHREIRDRVLADHPNGGVQLRSHVMLELPSGQRARSQSGSSFQHVSHYRLPADGTALKPVLNTSLVGTKFEVDPVIEADGKSIHLRFALVRHTAPPVVKRGKLKVESSDTTTRVDSEITHFHREKISREMILGDATVRLLALIPDPSASGNSDADGVLAVFLHARIQTIDRDYLDAWSFSRRRF